MQDCLQTCCLKTALWASAAPSLLTPKLAGSGNNQEPQQQLATHPNTAKRLQHTLMHLALCAGKKRAGNAKMGSRSPASPKQSTGSGSASKAGGGKQAGRRRSRVSLNQGTSSAEAGPQEEDDDEPSAKRSVLQNLLCRACHLRIQTEILICHSPPVCLAASYN